MKSTLLILGFTLASVIVLRAQFLTPQYHSSLTPNVLYLEVLGNGGKLSLNYDQLFLQTDYLGATGRFGIAAFPEGEGRIACGIPMSLSFLVGYDQLFGELGGGTRIAFSNNFMEDGFAIVPTGILGVRYQPDKNGGIFFRLAYTPFMQAEQLQHSAGFAVGVGFGR